MPGTTHAGRRASLVALTAALIAGLLPIGAPGVTAVVPASVFYRENEAMVTSDTATFSSVAPAPDNLTANVNVSGKGTLVLGAPTNVALTPGTYEGAVPTRVVGSPYIAIYPNCPGRFVVHEVSYSETGATTALAADWDTACVDGKTHRGSIRFNSSWPLRAVVTTPTLIEVGLVTTTTYVEKTVTVQSAGTADVTITGFSFAGTSPEWWTVRSSTCIGIALAPGATCMVTVRVWPQAGGDRAVYLMVNSDAALPATRTTRFTVRGSQVLKMSLATGPVVGGKPYTVTATMSPALAGGTVRFYVDDVEIGAKSISAGTASVTISAPAVAAGQHVLVGGYFPANAFTQYAGKTLNFAAKHPSTTSLTATQTTFYSDQSTTLTATVSMTSGLSGGLLQIRDATAGVILASRTVTSTGRTLTLTTKFTAGQHNLIAEYFGASYIGASYKTLKVTSVADTDVVVTSTSVGPATFYPYVDAYVDTATIAGVTAEPATVLINIYRSTGARVLSVNLGSKTGAYSYVWNGKDASGALLPNDTYRVDQKFTDLTGHTKTISANIVLSQKRIYTYTTTITAAETTFSAGDARGWEFTLPSAAVYKSLTLQVDAQTTVTPGVVIGGWDYRLCAKGAAWDTDCVSSTQWAGTTRAWYSKSLATTYNVWYRTVRAMAFIAGSGSGYVYGARLKVTYGVLK